MITEEPLVHGHTTRHLRSGVTMLLLVGLVLGGALFGWKAVNSDSSATTSTAAPNAVECGVPPAAVTPAELQVNVYNGTSRNGLAAATAEQVTAQGFVVLGIDNDPKGERITDVAVIRGAENSASAYLLMAYVPGATFTPDGRADGTLDLVVGDLFQAITPPAAPPAPAIMC